MIHIRVVVSGRSYDASSGLSDSLQLNPGASVDDAIRAICRQLGGERALPASCLVAVAGQHLGTLANHQDRTLEDGDELVLIVPVAGG